MTNANIKYKHEKLFKIVGNVSFQKAQLNLANLQMSYSIPYIWQECTE